MEKETSAKENTQKADEAIKIVTEGKTTQEIIDQELQGLIKLWDKDYIMYESNPL